MIKKIDFNEEYYIICKNCDKFLLNSILIKSINNYFCFLSTVIIFILKIIFNASEPDKKNYNFIKKEKKLFICLDEQDELFLKYIIKNKIFL